METTITQHDAVDRLFARVNYERQSPLSPGDFKLSNMIRLLDRIGNPHLACPVIHVAGTKGKGSVCTFISSILSRVTRPVSGPMKIGVYTSPHLERLNQRIMISGHEISDQALNAVLEKIEPVIDEFDARARNSNTRQLTFFEVITAAAFQAFADASVDLVVLEVGMGGRLDSTNVCQPDVCVITNISLDHTRQLGSTCAQIAAEKAGIIKPGVPVINGAIDPESRAVIEATAERNGCPIFHLDLDFIAASEPESSRFTYRSNFNCGSIILPGLSTGMQGRHQHQNAALAIAACQQFAFANPNESQIRKGLATASLPGRCEVFDTTPMVILDMAHNVASTTALATTLQTELPRFSNSKERILIFAASRDKDVAGMVAPLAGLFDRIIVTQYQENPRGRPVSEVLPIVTAICQNGDFGTFVSIAESPESAWRDVSQGKEDPTQRAICVAGSAFLVAELRPLIVAWSKDHC